MALAQLDVLEITGVAPWWPLAVVATGLVTSLSRRGSEAMRTGVWVAFIGCWLLVNTLGLGPFRWWNSWPLIVMAAGAFRIAWPGRDEDRGGGFPILAIGTWLLVSTHGWFGLGWSDSWPVLLVLVGLSMVLRAVVHGLSAARRQA
jgi:hypothetical protein